MSITNVITKITVDMAGDVKRFAVKAKQYDRATRVIVVSLLWDEVPYVLDSADTVRCNVHKPDGTIAIIEGDNIAVSGNTVTITLPGTALTAAGRAWADIEIETQDESQQVSCQCFEIDIAKSPVDDDSIISTNEFSAMKLATKAANDAAAAATAEIEATAAAGTAANQAAAAAQAATDAANQAAAAATASIQIDTTLTDNTKAAPAGMVGQIKEDLSAVLEHENLFMASSATDGYRIGSDGKDFKDTTYYVSAYIPVTDGVTYTKNSPTLDAYHRMALYTASKTLSRIVENSNSVTAQTGEAYIRICGLLTEKSGATLYASNGVTAVDKTARAEVAVNEAKIANVQDAFNTGLLKQSQLAWVVGAIDGTGLVVASNNRIITPVAYNFGATNVRVSFSNEYKIWLYTYSAPEMTKENFVRRASAWAMESFSFDAESQYYYAFIVGHADDSAVVISEGEEVTVEAEALFSASMLGEISDVTFPHKNRGLVSDNTPDFGNVVSSSVVSTSDYIPVRNCNALLMKVPYYTAKTSFGLIFYDENKTALFGYPFNYYGSYGTEYRKYPTPYNAKYFRFSYFSDTSTYGEFVGYRILEYPTKPYVFVAASDSSEKDKQGADFVCDGVNDEVELQRAIDTANGEVVLAEGTYYIDSFQNTEGDGTVTALHFGKYGQQVIRFAGIGIGGTRKLNTGNVLFGGATIRVSRSCYDSLDDNTQYAIFGSVTNGASRIYPNVTASIENINFVIPDNQKKIICIDGWMMGALSFKNIKAIAVADYYNLKKPVDGCIGIRGLQGSNFGCGNRWESAFVWGFYEGYAVSGEHVVGIDLGSRYCNYGFTFNRKTNGEGAWIHPITMINCCDEWNFNMPVFGKSGEHAATDGLGGRQAINLIDYNLEWLPSSASPDPESGGNLATELYPGQTYGSITYTMVKTYGGNSKNAVDTNFWATGSGMNVRTKNMAHDQSGTTAERKKYSPTYMQTYYDTDLNKLLIYDGSNWRDMAGLIIS